MTTIKVKVAREIIGAYGEQAGIQCPWCATRQYPYGRAGLIIRCDTCGELFELPSGYFKSQKYDRRTLIELEDLNCIR